MARRKTEPFQWRKSAGLLTQAMLREYVRWLFPQLGALYIPPQGVRDFTLGEQSRNAGKQLEPYKPRTATGPVLRKDLKAFSDFVFEAIGSEAVKNPYQLTGRCALIFIPEFKRLHSHIIFLLAKKRLATV